MKRREGTQQHNLSNCELYCVIISIANWLRDNIKAIWNYIRKIVTLSQSLFRSYSNFILEKSILYRIQHLRIWNTMTLNSAITATKSRCLCILVWTKKKKTSIENCRWLIETEKHLLAEDISSWQLGSMQIYNSYLWYLFGFGGVCLSGKFWLILWEDIFKKKK